MYQRNITIQKGKLTIWNEKLYISLHFSHCFEDLQTNVHIILAIIKQGLHFTLYPQLPRHV